METNENLPRRITLRRKINPKFAAEVFKTEADRKAFAKSLSHLISMDNLGDNMPYMPQPGDTYRWSIDLSGNNFWVAFDPENNLQFTLRCRYGGEEAETLIALANYVALRLHCEVIGSE